MYKNTLTAAKHAIFEKVYNKVLRMQQGRFSPVTHNKKALQPKMAEELLVEVTGFEGDVQEHAYSGKACNL